MRMTPLAGIFPLLLIFSVSAHPALAQVSREGWFPGSSSISEAEVIPPSYRGTWAPSQASCKDEDGVERLAVFANGVETYESGGRLERVTQAGQDRSVRVKLAYEGEGLFWDAIELWTLDQAGTKLTIVDGKGSRKETLIRCD